MSQTEDCVFLKTKSFKHCAKVIWGRVTFVILRSPGAENINKVRNQVAQGTMGARIEKNNKVQKKKWLQSKMTLKLRGGGGKLHRKQKLKKISSKLGYTTHKTTYIHNYTIFDGIFFCKTTLTSKQANNPNHMLLIACTMCSCNHNL